MIIIIQPVRMSALACFFLILGLHTTASSSQAIDTGYHLTKTLEFAGDGSWDYLIADSEERRLYVTHSTDILVLDIDSGQVVGKVLGLKGVHGVAIDRESGRGFASNGRSGSIAIFDLKTLAVIDEVPAGNNPDAIILNPDSKRVFAFNHSGGDVTVINASDGQLVGTTALGGEVEYAVSDGRGSVFANIEDTSEIVRIDTGTLDVVARWPLAPCEEPTGMAIDKRHHRLFSTCSNGILIVVDAVDGGIVANVPIGAMSDGVRFDPETMLIFTSNGEGSLSIIHEDTADAYRVVDSIPTLLGARTLELDLLTHKVFTARADRSGPPETVGGRPSIVPDTFVVLEFDR